MRQVDVDDILIGQGFTLLRFTGQIDPEGRDWLLEALHRQDETYPGGEYAQMIHDLTGFGDQLRHDHEHPEMAASTVTGTAATRGKDHESKKQTRAKRSKEKQGKSAKKSSWFVITDFQSPLVASWLERRVETIAADPH